MRSPNPTIKQHQGFQPLNGVKQGHVKPYSKDNLREALRAFISQVRLRDRENLKQPWITLGKRYITLNNPIEPHETP